MRPILWIVSGVFLVGWWHQPPSRQASSSSPIPAAMSETAEQSRLAAAPPRATSPEAKIEPAAAARNAEIVQAIIAQSAARYSGNCRCPEDTDKRGRRCGGRSAYSRGGGARPICSEADVTAVMIEKFQASRKRVSR